MMTALSGRNNRATMRDVAAAAEVSLKTVSRVVNDESGVRPDVRERVLAAAQRLNYRHNLGASNLRRASGRTGSIGALVQDLSNGYSAALLRSLEDAARDRGTAVLAASLDEEADREQALVHSLIERRVDGLVLAPASLRQEYLASELSSGFPVVFVDRKPAGIDADSVTVDNYRGGYLAAHHLLSHGHRRIAVVCDLESIPTAGQRLAGFLSAFAEHGVTPDQHLIACGLRSEADAAAGVYALLDAPNPPTAIFAARNSLSAGAARALVERGLRHTVALVGFDDFPLAGLLDPPLTVIRQDVGRIGALAAERLFARVDGDTSPPRHTILEPTLVVRGSGEITPHTRD